MLFDDIGRGECVGRGGREHCLGVLERLGHVGKQADGVALFAAGQHRCGVGVVAGVLESLLGSHADGEHYGHHSGSAQEGAQAHVGGDGGEVGSERRRGPFPFLGLHSYLLEDALVEVVAEAFAGHLLLGQEEVAIGEQAGRYVGLGKEGAQDGLFLERGLTFPVTLQQLFDVFVVHTFFACLYREDDWARKKLQLFANFFSCTVQIDLHLCLGKPRGLGNFVVAVALDVAQQHDGALRLGQLVDEAAHDGYALPLVELLVGAAVVGRGQCLHVVAVASDLNPFAFRVVQREAAADGQGIGLETLYLVPLVAVLPQSDQGFLRDVLRLAAVERNAQGKPEELVLQREDVGAESLFVHGWGVRVGGLGDGVAVERGSAVGAVDVVVAYVAYGTVAAPAGWIFVFVARGARCDGEQQREKH